MSIITEVETLLSAGKALQELVKNPQMQSDVATILSDVEAGKKLIEDAKAKLEDIISQISPEVKLLLAGIQP